MLRTLTILVGLLGAVHAMREDIQRGHATTEKGQPTDGLTLRCGEDSHSRIDMTELPQKGQAVAPGSRESEDTPEQDTRQNRFCCKWTWKTALPIFLGVVLLAPAWKLATSSGVIQSSSKPGRGFLSNAKQWIHTGQGLATMLLWPAYRFLQPAEQPAQEQADEEEGVVSKGNARPSQTQIEGETLQESPKSKCMSEKVKRNLRYAQTCALAGVATFYPLYNVTKRIIAGANKHYNKPDDTSFIFQDGSFWTNQTDWTIGISIGLPILLSMCFCKVFAKESSGRGSGCKKVIFATVIGVLALVNMSSIMMGGASLGNKAMAPTLPPSN